MINTPPLVSILTTVYNREQYIAACIESVLAQTLDDFELIIVDDCSTDNSHAVAERYRSDPRVLLYRNETNLGDYPNRNRAASLARGKYLKYVDGDDLIYPHCLELMVEGMETYPEAGYGISKEISGLMAPVLLSPRDAYRSHFFETGLFSVGPLDAIIRRDAFEALGGFSPARHTSDTDFFLRIGARFPGVMLVPGLVWWRHHDGQESVEETLSFERILDVTHRRHQHVCTALASSHCPLPPDEIRALRWRAVTQALRFGLALVRRGELRWASRIFQAAACGRSRGKHVLQGFSDECHGREVSEGDCGSFVQTRRIPLGIGRAARHPLRSEQRPALLARNTPVISVVMPVPEKSGLLLGAVESLLAQRFENWELILFKDGEGSLPVTALGLPQDPRIMPLSNSRIAAAPAGWASVLNVTRGRYLKYLLPQDHLYPHALGVMVSMMDYFDDVGLGATVAVGPYREVSRLSPRQVLLADFFATPMLGVSLSATIMRKTALERLRMAIDPAAPFGRRLQLTLAHDFPVARLIGGLAVCSDHRPPHFALYGAWPFGWATGAAALIPWLLTVQRVLTPVEAKYAALRLLRYLWHGGEPRLGLLNGRQRRRARFEAWHLARQHGFTVRDIISPDSNSHAPWSAELQAEERRIAHTPADLMALASLHQLVGR